ncbi:MAG: DNA-directed RNA polymerase subunit delta [Bacilli bacterium]|nr:DNA-directed RNA polymerase subunit delta [Bacilli bacterium]
MKLKNINPEELELMSYTDITYMMLKETKKTMNTPTLFKEICSMLDLSESTYEDKIGDYYTSLTMDKRFVMLDNNEWDIRDNHSVEIVMDEDEEDEVEEETTEEEIIEEEEVSDDTLYDDESDLDADDDEPLPLLDEDEEELDIED